MRERARAPFNHLSFYFFLWPFLLISRLDTICELYFVLLVVEVINLAVGRKQDCAAAANAALALGIVEGQDDLIPRLALGICQS